MADAAPPPEAGAAPPPNPVFVAPTANNNNNAIRDPLVNIQDRLFHTLFFRLTLAYARACPRPIRRLFETIILIKAVLCFFMLMYTHIAFARHPVQCLEHVKDTWPRDGILRVEIQHSAPENYTLHQSYEKEHNLLLRSRNQRSELSIVYSVLTNNGIIEDFFGSNEEEGEEIYESPELIDPPTSDPYEPENQDLTNQTVEQTASNSSLLNASRNVTVEQELWEGLDKNGLKQKSQSQVNNETASEELSSEAPQREKDDFQTALKNYFAWPEEKYIVEYSLEYGFLRLSPATRQKLNLSVELVVLDPSVNSCFGDTFSQFILSNFLGYDDVLITSIKSLDENEESKGYLRNAVSGAHYHFVSRWTSASSYFAAALVMSIFTVSISMLLRYSQHQIFVFIVDLLQMLEFNTNISFPAAPLLTVVLALVGMEAIMSEFFEDTTTAFYIILIVWLGDQYDAVFCHTPITKRYWLRFFYVYHFSFYAYHYRFSGQYSGIALLTMWLFTQHSMIYFFHHYELPVILQQAEIQDILMRNQPNGAAPPAGLRITATARLATAQAMAAAAAANNNNNANAMNNNIASPRIRGFSIGGIRFRFRFGNYHHHFRPRIPAQQAATPAMAPAASTGPANPDSAGTLEVVEASATVETSEAVTTSAEVAASSVAAAPAPNSTEAPAETESSQTASDEVSNDTQAHPQSEVEDIDSYEVVVADSDPAKVSEGHEEVTEEQANASEIGLNSRDILEGPDCESREEAEQSSLPQLREELQQQSQELRQARHELRDISDTLRILRNEN